MSDIRILSHRDFEALVRIFVDAYPGIKIATDEDRERLRKRLLRLHEEEPSASFYGLFREGQLLGIMCLYDFTMNFLQARIPAGGVGQLAVALPHKKEHVAKEMMLYSLRHFREQGTPFVTLYPFRPDFYRRMGFGYGTKQNQYRVKPAALPAGPSKAHIRYLGGEDRRALAACYQRFVNNTHGMMDKADREVRRLFENSQLRLVGYEKDSQLQGYLAFTFEPGDTFITNDLQIHELIYEHPEALSELLTFLHSQADQIRYVIINTQDEDLHHLLLDPRNDSGRLIPDVYHETNAQGVGLMYRIVDTGGILDRLGEHDFGGQTCTLKVNIADSFLAENAGGLLLQFDHGRLQRLQSGTSDAEVSLDVAEFSSLLSGTVSFKSLYDYGLAELSRVDYVDVINRVFLVDRKPWCTTRF